MNDNYVKYSGNSEVATSWWIALIMKRIRKKAIYNVLLSEESDLTQQG